MLVCRFVCVQVCVCVGVFVCKCVCVCVYVGGWLGACMGERERGKERDRQQRERLSIKSFNRKAIGSKGRNWRQQQQNLSIFFSLMASSALVSSR